jgi:1-deoxy-D-xylulose-5-phosphate reductoisomerase
MKRVVLLGSTGSIGDSTLKVAADLPREMRLVGLAARQSVDVLEKQARAVKARAVAMVNPAKAAELKRRLGKSARVFSGEEGLCELASLPEADLVLIAIVGTGGLKPALAAIRAGKDIAVASKEILVMAGEIIMREARRRGVRVLPVDSEHSAIFQCLAECRKAPGGGRGANKPSYPACGAFDTSQVSRLILTASGGPFRNTPREAFDSITPQQALKHPTWNMGAKVTIDSATLFNKGLETIEAHWLFGLPVAQIEVVIHPQSIIHSMVEYRDGSVLAQLSVPDMRYPIQYAVTYPRRLPNSMAPVNFAKLGALTFEAPDLGRFPALRLARQAADIGGTMPAVMNAANEVAVGRFLAGALKFPRIWQTAEQVMGRHTVKANPSLDEIIAADGWARRTAQELCR